jgi:hypothetical protein
VKYRGPIRHATPFEKLTPREQEAVMRCFPDGCVYCADRNDDDIWISVPNGSKGLRVNRRELAEADESRLEDRERDALRKFFPNVKLIAVHEDEVTFMEPNGIRPVTYSREELRTHKIELFSARPALAIAFGPCLPIFDDKPATASRHTVKHRREPRHPRELRTVRAVFKEMERRDVPFAVFRKRAVTILAQFQAALSALRGES